MFNFASPDEFLLAVWLFLTQRNQGYNGNKTHNDPELEDEMNNHHSAPFLSSGTSLFNARWFY
jgi:hypothetical protein